VTTGFLNQARIGDMLTCVGPIDIIATGAASVIVCGMPAARITDKTVHGGVIVVGCPTVFIGDPVVDMSAQMAAVVAHGGSTRVYVDPITKTVFITTNLEYSGAGATQAYADAAKQQIEDTWGGTMTHNGETYTVSVTVNTLVTPIGPPTPGYDQIVVDPSTTRMTQTLYGAGPGNQTPAAATDAARPRRVAHEYGHTLGLDDDYVDTPTGPAPIDPTRTNDIMSQTWPSADGTLPGPDQGHYDQILRNHGY